MASIFKSDGQGFLVGELIDNSRDLLSVQNRALPVWREIRSDVKSIARAMGVQVSNARRSSQPDARISAPAGPPRRAVSPAGRTSAPAAPAATQRTSSRSEAVRTTSRSSAAAAVQRDASGRFVAGQKRGGGEDPKDAALGSGIATLSQKISGLSTAMEPTENIDATVMAAKEIKDVVSPLGRGMFAMFGRTAERKKERWYQRIIKAITGQAAKPGTATAVSGGSDTRLFGGLIDCASGILPLLGKVLTRVFLPIAALWASFELGQWIGKKIYEWLVSSGLQEKLFGAVDAIKQAFTDVAAWAKSKYEGAKETVKNTVGDFKKGVREQTDPVKFAPAVPGQDGRNLNDPRRLDRAQANTPDGRMINDPRRVDADPAGRLPPATSAAQRAGRFVGGVRAMFGGGDNSIGKVVETGAGYNVVQRNNGSVVKQKGARNWRNNNPGNIEWEPGGFAAKHGAIGSDGRFAIFPTYEAGRAAKAALLFEGKNYKNLSLTDAISRYAPPSENNTKAYQKSVLDAVGGADKKLSEYTPAERTAILNAMQKVEGFKPGTVTPLGIAARPVAPAVSVSTASLPKVSDVNVPSPVPTKIPSPPEIEPLPTQLNSPSKERSQVTVKLPEVLGQNVGDRSLAHIVTGGMGGS